MFGLALANYIKSWFDYLSIAEAIKQACMMFLNFVQRYVAGSSVEHIYRIESEKRVSETIFKMNRKQLIVKWAMIALLALTWIYTMRVYPAPHPGL